MALRIRDVLPGSLAERARIRPGEYLVEINGQPLEDIIDYQFYLHDESIQVVVHGKAGKKRTISFKKAVDDDLGLELPEMHPRRCHNRCIFCFVDQLPPGMRRGLYFKDEDYRFSFLHGNYITLTDLGERDIERILGQRLSPLFISVHSTNQSVRKRLLGRQKLPSIIKLISRLALGGIQLHCQLVVCPGINDDQILRRSIEDLQEFFPAVQTVAIVPVGLTGHRQGLPGIQPMDSHQARDLVQTVGIWHRIFRERFGRGFVYLADEIFLMAGKELPPEDYYDDYAQIENGVGMVRHFLNQFASRQESYPVRLKSPKVITLITGLGSAPFLREVVVKRLEEIENLIVHLAVVPNRYLGGAISVSGLLTGSDILESFQDNSPQGTVILPPSCLNDEGLFLDDLSPADLERELGVEVKSTPREQPFQSLEEVWS
ncbi:MAG: hypothetical protein AMJ92_00700 [candidate division Zixibacteria bacterium SM23_81]|nr:MAG: hypothetical protein AMJ92_00700 [candidate division Zixibacteria bacterium SM23_81]